MQFGTGTGANAAAVMLRPAARFWSVPAPETLEPLDEDDLQEGPGLVTLRRLGVPLEPFPSGELPLPVSCPSPCAAPQDSPERVAPTPFDGARAAQGAEQSPVSLASAAVVAAPDAHPHVATWLAKVHGVSMLLGSTTAGAGGELCGSEAGGGAASPASPPDLQQQQRRRQQLQDRQQQLQREAHQQQYSAGSWASYLPGAGWLPAALVGAGAVAQPGSPGGGARSPVSSLPPPAATELQELHSRLPPAADGPAPGAEAEAATAPGAPGAAEQDKWGRQDAGATPQAAAHAEAQEGSWATRTYHQLTGQLSGMGATALGASLAGAAVGGVVGGPVGFALGSKAGAAVVAAGALAGAAAHRYSHPHAKGAADAQAASGLAHS
eukprot:scaffold1.g5670.t1